MSVLNEIQRITTNISGTYSALEAAGADMPAQQNSNNLTATVENLASKKMDKQNPTGTGTMFQSGSIYCTGTVYAGASQAGDPNATAMATASKWEATLNAAGWVGSAAPFTQTVSIAGILATDAPVIGLMASSNMETATAQWEAMGAVYRIDTADGSITASATAKPAVDLTLQILNIRWGA